MTSSNFLIGPIKDGLRKDTKPWATPEDSFDTLTNAYQFRGRLVRKPGYTKLGRLANGTPVMGLRTYENFGIDLQTLVAFDTTQAYEWNGTTFINLPSVMPVTWSGTDSQFFYTVNYANAFWATNSKPGLNGVNVSNAVAGAGFTTITTTTPHGFSSGQTVVLINLGGTPDLNGKSFIITVTGPTTFTIPFQTTGAYTAHGIALNSEVSVTGQDGIRYYGILTNGTGWANYNPPIDPNTALAGALLIFPYRGYLVFLNTTEGNDEGTFNFPNRARWTENGTPYYSEPVPVFPNPQGIDVEAARDDLFGKGGAFDAPTNETIVSAGFIRDILVVYFERSTWRLRFVNDAQNPFVWERVNIELGSECTFSTIPFDKGLMAIGNRGIVISDGNDTSRFDEKIPDEIFNIRQTNNGLQRVYGIRTFRTRLNFWTYPSADNPNGIYPDKVLVFNYDTKNWSFFDDCFTCFGYFYPSSTGLTWGDLPDAWSSYGNISWNSGVSQIENEFIVAGNQQGYVLQIQEPTEDGDFSQNEPSLSITAITAASPGVFTSPNNNLPDETWITLTSVTGTTSSDGVSLNGRNFKISNTGLSTIAISNINNLNPATVTTSTPHGFISGQSVTIIEVIGYNPLSSTTTPINEQSFVITVIGPTTFTIPLNGALYSPYISGGLVYLTNEANNFILTEFKPIDGGAASGTSYTYTIGYKNLFPGSIQINIGTLVFTDPGVNGVLVEAASLGSGTINYSTGRINLTFNPAIGSTEVWIRIVSLDPLQGLSEVNTTGAYGGGGEITKISNIDIQTKIFNFFNDDQRSRLSKIDFYVNATANGQFICNVFADSSNEVVNDPLPDNLQSNVVLTSPNPYQIGQGDETIFRLYCDALAQTIQLQLTMSDQQMATSCINKSDIQILAMMFTLRRGGRIV